MAVGITWPRLYETLQPRTGKRFALVRDTVVGTMLLVDIVQHCVVMSDSKLEQETNVPIIERGYGDVLCLGYGLGFIYGPLVAKPEVRSVTVIELEPEVLELVASQQNFGPKLRIVQADALTWQPDMSFDVIWDDCAYKVGDTPNNISRLRSWLKPNGLYLEWHNNGQYRP